MLRTYSELMQLHTFESRFKYLKLYNTVGEDTFGFERYLNQRFYKSSEWRRIRDFVIVRDKGCDLGIEDHEITGEIILVHHMNPMMVKDLSENPEILLNPEFLITVSHSTHNAIHYGDMSILEKHEIVERFKNDTIPWRK